LSLSLDDAISMHLQKHIQDYAAPCPFSSFPRSQ